jgi:excisionase family DNA binding protein
MQPGDVVTLEEAAARLGLSRVRVQKLVESGRLPASRRAGAWWIDARALERRRRDPPGRGRPLSSAAAWLVLLLASDEPETPEWRSLLTHGHMLGRARRWLDAHSLVENSSALRARAEREQLDGHPSEFPLILAQEHVRATGISAASSIGLSGGPEEVEFYAPLSMRAVLLDDHALGPAANGAVVARWVPDAVWPAVAAGQRAPGAAVLVDLLEHDDPRARREAAAALAQ